MTVAPGDTVRLAGWNMKLLMTIVLAVLPGLVPELAGAAAPELPPQAARVMTAVIPAETRIHRGPRIVIITFRWVFADAHRPVRSRAYFLLSLYKRAFARHRS